jgi:inorganic triphosphatase YgiF
MAKVGSPIDRLRRVILGGVSPIANEGSDAYEVELKLQPSDAAILDAIWKLDRLGSFEVVSRRRQLQRNRYYDSRERALGGSGGSLRWRTTAGSTEGELTYKGPSEVQGGVFRRLEITSLLPSDVDPVTVEPAPAPLTLAHRITTDLEPTELILETDRRAMRLVGNGARVDLDLDITTMPGTDYYDLEIEAEIVSGDPDVLTQLHAQLITVGDMKPSAKGKLARGWGYLKQWELASRVSRGLIAQRPLKHTDLDAR